MADKAEYTDRLCENLETLHLQAKTMNRRIEDAKARMAANNAFKINAYEWTSEELYDLGCLLRNIGQTICSAGGRLKQTEGVTGIGGKTVKIESLSTLNDAVSGVCSLGWEIRNKVNEKVTLVPGSTPTTQKSLQALRDDLAAMQAIAKTISDSFSKSTIEASMDDLRERIAKAEETIKPDTEDTWNVDMERLDPASLPETCHLESVAYAAEQIFGAGGVDEVHDAVSDFQHHGCHYLWHILNLEKSAVRQMTSKRSFEVFEEVLSLFGYKWRTDGDATRFDLPIGRFSFAQSAFRKRSERRAATFFRNGKVIKRNTTKSIYEAISRVMDNATNAITAAEKLDNSVEDGFMDAVHDLESWMHDANIILKAFKGIIPHRLWYFRAWDSEAVDNGYFQSGFANSVSDVVSSVLETLSGSPNDASMAINISNTLFLSPGNRYLSNDARDRMKIREGNDLLQLHQLIYLIASCIWEWTACVEENELFKYEERTVKEKEPGPVSCSVAIGKIVYDPELVEQGKLPMAWETECSDWGQEIINPISFWQRIR